MITDAVKKAKDCRPSEEVGRVHGRSHQELRDAWRRGRESD